MVATLRLLLRNSLVSSILAVLVGVVAKLSLTNTELLPGLDGAYYWVQVRSLLEDHSLAFPDLPLVFWVQAGLAKIFGSVTLAVRLSDAILPALSAIPIYLIGRKYKSPLLPAISILVVLLHPIQLYFFTGDFIKNEAAIPAVFFIALVLLNWDNQRKVISLLYLAILFSIVVLSHFGTALLALIFVGVWAILQLRKIGGKIWIRGFAIFLVAISVVLYVFKILIPDRFERLLDFVTTPSIIIERPILDGMIHGYANSVISFTIITNQVACLILALVVWKNRQQFSYSQRSLVVASLISTFILSSPFISIEWANRLTGLSIVPLTVAAIMVFGCTGVYLNRIPVVILSLIVLLSSLFFIPMEKKYVFSNKKYADFKELVNQVTIPNNSIIVARHGVQYLAAWHFKTDVVLDNYFESSDLSSYAAVYLLVEKPGSDKKKDFAPPSDLSKDEKSSEKFPGGKPPSGGKELDPQQLEGQRVFGNNSFTLVRIR